MADETTIPVVNKSGSSLRPADLPKVFRLVGLDYRQAPDGRSVGIARLYHDQASLRVSWECRRNEVPLQPGMLVSPRWLGRSTGPWHGACPVSRLVAVAKPVVDVDLFETVPYEWVRDRELIARAKALTAMLPAPMLQLFTAIFWEGRRFLHFVAGPSSLNGHHHGKNGNLRHTVEVAEVALRVAENRSGCCREILLLAALLHDAGKAEEYIYDPRRGMFEISDRGALLGHKLTVVEWIAAAMARHAIAMPEAHYLSLLHAITASQGVPEWSGFREPRSLEAMLLSMADRLSGNHDLIEQVAPPREGFGRYHRHLRGRPYVLGSASS